MKEKKENLKSNIKLFKQLWKNPKYKATIKLGFYLIFVFLIVFIIRFCGNENVNSTTSVKEVTPIQKLEAMNNYEYEININENQSITTLKGIKYKDINDFEVAKTKEKYTIIDNNIYKKTNNELVTSLLNINIISLFPENLKQYVLSDYLKNEISYKDNETKKEYYIYGFNLIGNINNNKYIILTTYENNHYIYKIEIDATEVMKDINSGINNYNIDINYNNINKIKEYKSS